tara:strand:- start:389 stop:883 length:495 start_codon:yes stop_codon:yes gene_type:complete
MDKSFSGRSKTELIKYAPEVSVVKKSELLQIIREELEVVLTNEEAVELFDLDPAALLDEFVDESVGKDSRVPKTPKDATKAEKKAANKRARKAGKKAASEDPPGEALNEEDDWIGGAVDPEHEGYCTPMTKSTCTPKRKALAKRFKKAAKKKKREGGTGWQGKV